MVLPGQYTGIFSMSNLVIMILRGLVGSCPNCGKAGIFKGLYALHKECPNCHTPFERMVGDFTGAAYVNVVATSAIVVLVSMVLVATMEIPLAVLLLAGIPIIVILATILHKPIKGVWVAILVYIDQMERENSA